MKKRFCLLQILFCSVLLSAQEVEWAISAGSQWNETGLQIQVDEFGNSYVAGWINSVLNSSFFIGDVELKPDHSPDIDLFLIKIDKNGSAIWGKTFGSFSTDQIWSMTLDSYNNIWIAGEAVLPPLKIDSFTLTTPNITSAFALKISSDGDFLWGRFWDQIEHRGTSTTARCICADKQGAVYYAGTFNNDSLVVDNFTLYRAPRTSETLYLLKLDQQGQIIWARTNTSGAFSANDCVVDQNNDLYLLGGTNGGDVTFDSLSIVGQYPGLADPVLLKFNAEGQALWARTATGPFADFARGISIDDNNTVVIAGLYNSRALAFDQDTLFNQNQGGTLDRPTSFDVFVAQFNERGNLLWVQSYGGSKDDGFSSFDINQDNQIIIVGNTLSTDLLIDNQTLINEVTEHTNFYILQFSNSGDFMKGVINGGALNDGLGSVAIDLQNNIHVVGSFVSDTLSFGSLLLPNSYPPGNNPTEDILIAKLTKLTTSTSSPASTSLPFQLFPNPADEQVHIDLAATLPYTNWQMSIYDITGRLRKKVDLQQQRRYLINTNDLENGTFIIKLYNEQKVSYTTKLMIIR